MEQPIIYGSGATNNRINKRPHLLVIDGAIGVGKSSVIKSLSEKLNALVIPEYIDEPNGIDKLNEYLNDKPKYAFDFQMYILNHYREYIKNKTFKDYDYVIMERDPLRGVVFFARMDLNHNYISLDQYNKLFIEAVNVRTEIKETLGCIDQRYKILYDTSNKSIDEITNEIINDFLNADEIILRATPKIIYERINKRNRKGETNTYDMDYINNMCKQYYNP